MGVLLNNGDLLLSKQSWKLQTELKGECSQSHQEDWLEQGKAASVATGKPVHLSHTLLVIFRGQQNSCPRKRQCWCQQSKKQFPRKWWWVWGCTHSSPTDDKIILASDLTETIPTKTGPGSFLYPMDDSLGLGWAPLVGHPPNSHHVSENCTKDLKCPYLFCFTGSQGNVAILEILSVHLAANINIFTAVLV